MYHDVMDRDMPWCLPCGFLLRQSMHPVLTIFCHPRISPPESLHHNDDNYCTTTTTAGTTATTTATTTAATAVITAAYPWDRCLEGAEAFSERHRRPGLQQPTAPLPACRLTTHKSTGLRNPARLSSTALTTTTTILPALVVFDGRRGVDASVAENATFTTAAAE